MIMSIPTQRTARAIQRSRSALALVRAVSGAVQGIARTVADRLVRNYLVGTDTSAARRPPAHRLRALDRLGEALGDELRKRTDERLALRGGGHAQDGGAGFLPDRLPPCRA